jgi:1-acyl-sn-glycerol-3-phosphate acyltransferase
MTAPSPLAPHGSRVLPAYSALAFRGFELMFRPWQARRLQRATITGLPHTLIPDRPLLLLANHTSWWDGFLLRDVQLALRPRSPLYTVMTARELQRFPFLRRLGATPLDTDARIGPLAMFRALRTAAQRRPDCTIAFFPQGRIRPSWTRPLGFQRGLELLVRSIGPCHVVPVALHVEPLNAAAPTAFVVLGPALQVPGEEVTAARVESAVTGRLDELFRLLAAHGEGVHAHLPQLAGAESPGDRIAGETESPVDGPTG